MSPPQPQFMLVGSGAAQRRIATLLTPAKHESADPGLIWLPGFKSEMTSIKATALAEWGAARGRAVTRFDYSGHGQSGGRFEDGRLGHWLEEALTVIRTSTRGPQIIVGSSMGGGLALLVLRALQRSSEAQRIAGLMLIAPAWDMATLMWDRMQESARREVLENGVWMRPSQYGDGPYAITRGLVEEARTHLIGNAPFDPGCPVRILHGLQDPDVPYEHSLDLVAHLSGDWTRMTAIPDGEHRLSRPEDLAQMFTLIEEVG